MGSVVLGIDLGTSGLRGCIVDGDTIVSWAHAALSAQTPDAWRVALERVLTQLQACLGEVGHVICDATSSTVMLWREGEPASPVRMYDQTGHPACGDWLRALLPADSGAHGSMGTLCKVLSLKARFGAHKMRITHQIDWLNAQFLGFLPPTDWNNALKLGFDPVTLRWPDVVRALVHPLPLPQVVAPGTPLGHVSKSMQDRWSFRADCTVHAGTTDSIAAFLAAGANRVGDAVTSLGSTLAIKLLSERPVFAPDYGIYSHRLPFGWLAGGASNAGGKVLLDHFDLDEIRQLSAQLNPDEPTGLDYYPLTGPGERFPINDNNLKPIIDPVPEDRARFLQGLLEGLVKIERMGYERLMELGASPPRRIFCAGGGCANDAWMRLRARMLLAPLAQAANMEAAFGVTRLLERAPA